MKKIKILILWISFTLNLSVAGMAQQRETHLLNELIEEALSHNQELQAAREEWEAARDRVPQSSALPDPTAGYAVMGPMLETRLGPQEDMYEFEQMIPFPGKLIEKRKMASAQVEMASARLKETERGIIFKVSEAYYELFAVEATLKSAEEVKGLMMKLESIAQSRYASQGGSQSDVAKVQAEVSETIQRIFILRQQKDSLLAWLKAILNRDTDLVLENFPEPEVPFLGESLEELLQEAKMARPELLEAVAFHKKEQHANTLAKYENAPDLSVGFRYTRIGVGNSTDPDAGRDAWMIPVKITLPLWQNRIGSAVQEAKRNLNASEAKLDEIQNMTEYETKNAYYQFKTAGQVVELYKNALIPQAEIALRSDQAGYESGRTDIINLIDSERRYLNAKTAYFQALAEALKNFAGLERVIGKSLM